MLKRFLILLGFSFLILSCEKSHPNDYMSISGKIENITEQDSIFFITGFAVRKKIKVNADGTFQDSLKITKPTYHSVMLGGTRAYLWLKNGYDLKFTGNKKNFFKSFKFKGNKEGAHTNQLLVDQYTFGQSAGNIKGFMLLEKQAFLDKVDKYKRGMDSLNNIYPNADTSLVEDAKKQNESFFSNLLNNYDKAHPFYVEEKNALDRLKDGNPAPNFENFENYNGGTSSLTDFKGKYVYIDVWATWCMPCIVQIPHLKKLQEKYKGKNIEFISISTDSNQKTAKTWKEARAKWRKMVKEKELDGVQLWAGENHTLHKDYYIRGIPRFILIDPEGKLIDYSTRRPTDPKLIEILDKLLL